MRAVSGRDDYVAYLQDYAAGMRLRLGARVRLVDRAGDGWALRLGRGSIKTAHVVVATGPDAEPVMPAWPGMAGFAGIVIHAGKFRNAAAMAGLDVLVVGPGNSGVDLLGHLAGSDAGKLWLSARSGMTITPRRLGGVPLHPVSVLGRYLPLRWQDANARAVQQVAFGDLTRLGYPRPALGAFTRAAADGVTIAVDDGFVRALKSGRVTMKPAIDRFDGRQVCFADGTGYAADAIICATGCPGLEQIAGHLVALDAHGLPHLPAPHHHRYTPACGSSAWTAASTATCTSGAARHASSHGQYWALGKLHRRISMSRAIQIIVGLRVPVVPAHGFIVCRCSSGSADVCDRPNRVTYSCRCNRRASSSSSIGDAARGHDRAEAFGADRVHLLGLSLGIDP